MPDSRNGLEAGPTLFLKVLHLQQIRERLTPVFQSVGMSNWPLPCFGRRLFTIPSPRHRVGCGSQSESFKPNLARTTCPDLTSQFATSTARTTSSSYLVNASVSRANSHSSTFAGSGVVPLSNDTQRIQPVPAQPDRSQPQGRASDFCENVICGGRHSRPVF